MNLAGHSPRRVGPPLLPWRWMALWFVASRILIFVLGWASTYILAEGPADRSRNWLPLLQHWDANWYLQIAREGYHPTKDGLITPNFFPLFPLLVRAVHLVFHDYRLAGLVVSNACTFGAGVLLWRLVRGVDDDEKTADRAVLFFLFNPVAVFYAAPYTEGLFTLLLIAVAWFSQRRQWLRAGSCGYLLTLSRPVGILVLGLLAAEFLKPHLEQLRSPDLKTSWPDPQAPAFLTGLVLTVAGVATYSAWLAVHFGDPLLFLHAAGHWGHRPTSPWFTFFEPSFGMFYRRWFQSAVLIALILLGLGRFLQVRRTWLVMTVIYLVASLSTGHMESIPRYLSVLFPFYIVVARITMRWPRTEPVLFAGSVALMTFSTVLFVNGYWFT